MKKELVIYGDKAVISFLEHRLPEVKRFFFTAKAGNRYAKVCRELARQKKIYRQVDDKELKKISGSEHHGGVALVAEIAGVPILQPADLRPAGLFFGKNIVFFDHVDNPHNLGAIVRSAVFFGVNHFIVPANMSQVPAAAWRVAAGGMTHAVFRRAKDLTRAVAELSNTHILVAAATRNGKSLAEASAHFRQARRPFVLLLGNEEQGLSQELEKQCEWVVTLKGSGQVESLNVSHAAAIFLATLA